MSETASITEIYCPQCGYDLRAIESERCPECGLAIDRSSLGESIIPWLHRAKIGRYRAFWRTVHLATFQVRKLSTDMNRPARFADAVKFRRLVVLHAWAPLVAIQILGAVLLLSEMNWQGVWTDARGSILQIILFAFWSDCLWFFLLTLAGVGSYFFHPASLSIIRQNRAIALSYYACAPLAYAPATLLLLGGAVFLMSQLDRNPPLILLGLGWLAAIAPLGIQVASMFRVPLVMLKATTHCDRARQAIFGVSFAAASVGLGVLWLIVLPLAAMVMALMVLSLGR